MGWSIASGQVGGNQPFTGEITEPYHAAIQDYFKVLGDKINDCQQRNVNDEEIPVVLFMAQRAGVGSEAVLAVRAGGLNWMQVAYHFHLNPKIFFMSLPANGVVHTPYEKSYGYFKNHSDRVNFTDTDVINWVNLKFISEHYGRDPEEIIKMRSAGKSFRDISVYYHNKKEEAKWDVEEPREDQAEPAASDKKDKALDAFEHSGHMGMGGM